MSTRYCLFCHRELDPMSADGCECHLPPPEEIDWDSLPGLPKEGRGTIDIDDRNYEAHKARRYEREQQLNDMTRRD